MNKAEFVAMIAEKSGLTRKQADAAVAAFTQTVIETLKSGDKVQLMGFGTFDVKQRAARTGHNPKTKEPIEIPAANVVSFKAGKNLKDNL